MDKKQDTLKRDSKFYNDIPNKIIRDLLDEYKNKNKIELFAKQVNVTPEAVRLWCSGYSRPSIDKIPIIAKYFNVSTDYLLGLSDVKSPNVTDQEIGKKLGLDDNAIKKLSEIYMELKKDEGRNALYVIKFGRLHESLNFLLKDKEGLNFLARMSEYLYYDFYTIKKEKSLSTIDGHYEDIEVTSDRISLIEKHSGLQISYSADIFLNVFLLELQNILTKLRAKKQNELEKKLGDTNGEH